MNLKTVVGKLSVKGQTVNILGFEGVTPSVTTAQLPVIAQSNHTT